MENIDHLPQNILHESFITYKTQNLSDKQTFSSFKSSTPKIKNDKDNPNSISCSSFFRKKTHKKLHYNQVSQNIVGPGYYNVLPECQYNKGKGFTFSKQQKIFCFQREYHQRASVPAPNEYQINMIKLNRSSSFKFGLEQKKENLFNLNLNTSNSDYINAENLSDRKYTLAIHLNPPKAVLNTSRVRFDNERTDVPGPGEYEDIVKIGNNKCPISNISGTGRRFFDKENRNINFYDLRNSNPGPGAYEIKSSFVHADFKKKPTPQ